MNKGQAPVSVAVSIDTEEDNWGAYEQHGETTYNIDHLVELQAVFDKWAVHPTYLVNHAPLVNSRAVEILGRVAACPDVEIGAHCHPWNTPPYTGSGQELSMMAALPEDVNRRKVQEVGRRLLSELGVRPRSFRAGRWGFGSSVARVLVGEGYAVDTSVTPFVDWSQTGGPDYGGAPHLPYRFDPDAPFVPVHTGALLELPTTVGFLAGNFRAAARTRRRLETTPLLRNMVGPLDRLGFIAKRWLSPENSTADTMIRLAHSAVASGQTYLQATFHSSALLPGATPFVRTEDDRKEFLRRLDGFLSWCSRSGFAFLTLSEIEALLFER